MSTAWGPPGGAGGVAPGPDPARIGPYRVLRPLGAGGMGRVYLARSPGGNQVAVKLLRPELAADAAYRARFAAEAAAARAVAGVYTAAVVDADPHAARPWLATAYVAGPTLEQRIRRSGPMDERRLRELGAGLAEALLAIHRAGVVHRDLKPSNVLMSVDGPRVIDFGISKGPAGGEAAVGTGGYAAPEQAAGSAGAGRPGDVFSLGAVLAFAALGRGPFGTGDPHALRYRVAHEEPNLDGVPAGLRVLIGRCLLKNPHARPSVAEVLTAVAPRDWLPAGDTTFLEPAANAATGATGTTAAETAIDTKTTTVALTATTDRALFSRRSVLTMAGLAAGAVTVVAGGLSLLESFGILTDGHQDVPSGSSAGASVQGAAFTGAPQGFAAAPAPQWSKAPATPPEGGSLQLLGSTLLWLSDSIDGTSSVYAFDASTGRQAWPASATSTVTSSPDGTWYGVYGSELYGIVPTRSSSGAFTSELYGVNEQGTAATQVPLGAQVDAILCVSGNTLVASTGSNSSALTAFDLRTGRQIWSASNPGDKSSNVIADSTRCYLFGSSTAYALDLATGRTVWKASGVLDDAAAYLWPTPHVLIVAGQAASSTADLGIAGAVALDPATGRRLWQSSAYCPVAVSGSTLYALGTAAGSRIVAALDAADGSARWTFQSPVPLETTFAPFAAVDTGAGSWASDRVLALPYQGSSSTAGGFLVLDAATGKALWARGTLGAAVGTGWPAAVSGNAIYVASPTTLYAFKTGS